MTIQKLFTIFGAFVLVCFQSASAATEIGNGASNNDQGALAIGTTYEKTGSGRTRLTASATSTGTSTLALNEGSLHIDSGNALDSGNSTNYIAVNMADGTEIYTSQAFDTYTPISVTGTGDLSVIANNNFTLYGAALTGTGRLRKTGDGILNITRTVSVAEFEISDGEVRVQNTSYVPSGTIIFTSGILRGNTGGMVNLSIDSTGDVSVGTRLLQSLAPTITGTGTLTLDFGDNGYTGALTLSGTSTVLVPASGSLGYPSSIALGDGTTLSLEKSIVISAPISVT